jgi:peptidoglycan/LPS O-acetylase OafA/YrhL
MKRISELDSLRGLAALSVLLFHYTTRYQQIYGHPSPTLFSWNLGFHGVDLFFMISGFVIFMTLERVGSGMDFVISRFSRLFPAYWAAVLITFTVVAVFGLPGREVGVPEMLVNLTMIQGFLGVKDVDGAYWTLQVELFFYIGMLAVYYAGLLPRIRSVLAIWVALRLVYLAADQLGVHLPYRIGEALILQHIPLFSLGILFFRLYANEGTARGNYGMMALCLAAIGLGGRLDYLVTALGGCVIFYLLIHGRLKILAHRIPVFFGAISYSLYLLHENIGFTIIRALYEMSVAPDIAILIAGAVLVLCATTMTYVIEKPSMRYIRATYKRRMAAAPGSTQPK